MANKEKKVILILVEGPSDKTSFESVLKEYFSTGSVYVDVLHGDITIKDSPTTSNIKSKVLQYVQQYCSREKIREKDIIKIVHLVDTDGAFIDSCNILQDDSVEEIFYGPDNVRVQCKESTIKRFNQKSSILRMLSTTGKIKSIDYSIYYFSRNLEHVLHNRSDYVSDDEKKRLSILFDDEYGDNLNGFLGFIRDNSFAVEGSYKETWDFIQQETNSLHRHSNFHLLFAQTTIFCNKPLDT